MVHLFPAAIRHSIVDLYISKRMTAFEKNEKMLGDRWIESIPGWKSVHSEIGTSKMGDLISDFWRGVPANDQGNAPACYAQSPVHWDIDLLKGHVDRLLPAKGTVLDFGCNAGRVLHCFLDDGYHGVGVDINPKAVELGKRTFPSLAKAKFCVGDGPEALAAVAANSVDLIYSCAVLRHVAPEKIDAVIAEFSRIGPKYIITLEDEASLSYRTFPHNYRSKFAHNGWREVLTQYVIDVRSYVGDIGGLGTMLRIYTR
jgi:SAM-dependent methyltransferase